MAARKITVKEMKHDRFAETVMEYAASAGDWAIENWKLLAASVGAILVVGLCATLWMGHVENRQKASRIALAEALEKMPARMQPVPAVAGSEGGDLEAAAEALTAVAGEYAGYEGGNLALYYLAVVHLDEGRFEEATATAETFTEEAAGHRLVPLALWVQARAHARRGDAEQTVSLYRQIADLDAPMLPPGLARLYLAEYLETQDRLAEALEIYQELAADEEGAWAGSAQRKVDEIQPIVEAESGAAA